MAEVWVEIKGLSKRFGAVRALEKTDLEVKSGEIYALVGPNGSGKTTLLKSVVGLLRPTTGSVRIVGRDVSRQPWEAKREFGYVSDNPQVYPHLSGMEFLYLTGRLRGMRETELGKRVEELVEIFPIKEVLKQPMASYSRGNIQKTAFLAALLAWPKVLFIDEPIVGLDPVSIEIMGESLRRFASEGGAVLFVTHILNFAQEYADRVGLLFAGKLVAEKSVGKGSLERLYRKHL